MRFVSLASLCVLTVLLVPRTARAAVEGADDASPTRPFVFGGRAIYVGGGAGMLTDLGAPTQNWSILATFPLARWLSVEATGFGFHFQAPGAIRGKLDDSVALGIGVGLRLEPPVDHRVRPYLAGRFEHIHMLFDPIVDPMSTDRTSMHRWGLAAALGVEFAMSQRLRTSIEAGPTVFTGTGTNGGGQAVASFGIAF